MSLRRPVLLMLLSLGTVACGGRIEVGDPGASAADTAETEGTVFAVGPMRVGLGVWNRREWAIPSGNPTYLIDIPDPGSEPMTCQIDTYYSVGNRPGFSKYEDIDAQMAPVANPAANPLPALSDDCHAETCFADPSYTGARALVWGFMVYGVKWTFEDGNGLRLVLRPTSPIVDNLRITAACQPR